MGLGTVGMFPAKGFANDIINTGIEAVGSTETGTINSTWSALLGNAVVSFDGAEVTMVAFSMSTADWSFTLGFDVLSGNSLVKQALNTPIMFFLVIVPPFPLH